MKEVPSSGVIHDKHYINETMRPLYIIKEKKKLPRVRVPGTSFFFSFFFFFFQLLNKPRNNILLLHVKTMRLFVRILTRRLEKLHIL